MSRGRSDRRGQALVEFALTLPLLMVLLMGIVEIGRAWNMKQTLTDAAREGARLAVVANPALADTGLKKAAVRTRVRDYLGTAGMNKTLGEVAFKDATNPDNVNKGTGLITTVRVAYPFRFVVIHRLASILQLDSLRTAVRMRNE